MQWYGYNGKIAEINLTTGVIRDRVLDEEIIHKYVGGRGFAVKFLLDYVSSSVSPLSPENILALAAGPLTGTIAPTSARISFASKAPETGIMTTGNAGGTFGTKLKWAGYDGLIILGKAKEPVYLLINNGSIQILSARDLWGKTVQQTVTAIRTVHKDSNYSIACIGPGGESLASIATIIIDRVRSAGRGGLGAVMGSKNLKAIAVTGQQSLPIYSPKKFWQLSLRMNKRANEKGYVKSRYEKGTYGALTRYNSTGALSTYNAQTTHFEPIENIAAEAFNARFKYRTKACFSCSIPCWPVYIVKEGQFTGFLSESVTATTFKELGARCGVSDMATILVAHSRLNNYGLDTISAPATIAFAMECYEKGILTKADTGGLELEWGRGDVLLELIEQMAYGKGLGKELSYGVRACSQAWGMGSENFALHVKGMETVATDPRGLPAWGLGYATSSRGACHMRAYSNFEYKGLSDEEMLRIAGTTRIAERYETEGKGKAVAYLENMRAYGDSLGLCHILTRGELGFPEVLSEMLEAATGVHLEAEELLQVGERIMNMERIFNLKNGLTPADDTLPKRYTNEPVPDGPAKGKVCELAPMLDEYYVARNWDRDSGYPMPEKTSQLGLDCFLAERSGT